VIFERPTWKDFYLKLKDNEYKDKEFLRCISLLKEHGKENLTLAMELAMESKMDLKSSTLKELINNEFKNVLSIEKLPVNLDQYNFLLGENKNEPRTEDACRT
jgi:hypothetical protein